MTTTGKVSNENPVASPKANLHNVAIPPTPTSTKPLLVSQSPTPAWQSKPVNPYKRVNIPKSELDKVRLTDISMFTTLASSYIDILVENDTSIITTPWYYMWTTWVQQDILATKQISAVTSIIGYPKSQDATLKDVAEFILGKIPILQPLLTFHKNTKCDLPLCGTYRPILLSQQKNAAATKDPPPQKVFAALHADQDDSDDEALALDFGDDIEELQIIDSLTLGATTTNLEQTDLVLPTDLIEEMIAVATIAEEKIEREI